MFVGSPDALRARVTENAAADTQQGAQHYAQQSGRETGQTGATACDETNNPAEDPAPRNPLQLANIDDTLPAVASRCGVTAPLAQLAEQLTLNQ